jgi:hypothetical protein
MLTEAGLTDEYSRERYKGYELAFHLIPYPEAGKKIPVTCPPKTIPDIIS